MVEPILRGNLAEESRDGEFSFATEREDVEKVLGAVLYKSSSANLQKVFSQVMSLKLKCKTWDLYENLSSCDQ